MVDLNTMRDDVTSKLDIEFQAKLKKYRGYMDLVSKCFSAVVPLEDFDAVKSYIIDNKYGFIRLRCHNHDIHYVYIDIGVDEVARELKIVSFLAHDAYYDPAINFDSDDKAIVKFFDREFNNFKNWLNCDRFISVKKLVKAINDAIYSKCEQEFVKLHIYEHNFEDSKYALKLSDEYGSIIKMRIRTFCEESGLDL